MNCKDIFFLTRQINFYSEGELIMVVLIRLLIETEIKYLSD